MGFPLTNFLTELQGMALVNGVFFPLRVLPIPFTECSIFALSFPRPRAIVYERIPFRLVLRDGLTTVPRFFSFSLVALALLQRLLVRPQDLDEIVIVADFWIITPLIVTGLNGPRSSMGTLAASVHFATWPEMQDRLSLNPRRLVRLAKTGNA